MALSGKNFDFSGPGGSLYYCDGDAKSTTACGTSGFTIRNYTYHTWLRTNSFKTGGKNVTKIRLWAHDTSATSYYGYKGILGLSSTLYNPSDYSSSIPSFTYSGQTGTNYYETYTYNTYYVDLNVNLNPNTDYYMYVGVASGGAWQAVNYSSSSRYTHYYVEFLESSTATYTISYNANGGSGAPSSQTKTHGTNLTLSSTKPTRTGYTFLGWSTSSTATSATWKAGGTYSTEASNTLYAVWQINSYTCTIKPNGGSYINSSGNKSTADDSYTFKGNHTYAPITATSTTTGVTSPSSDTGIVARYYITKPTRTGYTFSSWSASPTSVTITSYTFGAGAMYSSKGNPQCSFTATAQWTANTYTVSYNGNGNTGGSTDSSSHTYDTAKTLTTNGFTRTGYSFSGWNTKSDGSGTAYTDGQSVSNLTSTNGGTVTLYAQWTINSYTLTVNKGNNISSVSGGGTKNYNASCSISATPNTGYKFINWTGYSTSTDNPYTFNMPASNATYTANAQGVSYTVVYHSNGGTGTMTNSSHTYGTASTLSKNAFAKTGYSFQGWSTSESSSSITYTDEANASALSTTDGATINLYAVWEAKSQMFIWTTKQLDGTTGTTGRWVRVLKYVYNNLGTSFTLTVSKNSTTNSSFTYSVYSSGSANKLITDTASSKSCTIYNNQTIYLQINRTNGQAITYTLNSGTANIKTLESVASYKIYEITNPTSDLSITYTVQDNIYEL